MSFKFKLLSFIFSTIFLFGFSSVFAADNLNLGLEVYTCNNNAVCDAGENSTYCLTDCPVSTCGNSSIDPGEQCDTGASRGNCPSSCSLNCLSNDCGGGHTLLISGIVVASTTDVSTLISWTTNYSATCQLVYGLDTNYSVGSSAEVIDSSSHSSQLNGLIPETTYHFKISCSDSYPSSAVSGDYTFITTSTINDVTPPGVVTGLRAVAGNKHIVLYWTNPSDLDFGGVVIRRSTDYFPSLTEGVEVYDGFGTIVGSEVSFDNTGLINDTLYYYSVFSYDTALVKNFSSGVGVSATPRAATTTPNNVTGLRIIPNDEKLTLFWTNPLDVDFAGVIIRRSTVGNPTFVSGAKVYEGTGYPSGDEYNFPNLDLINNQLYYYTVFAYNNAGYHATGVSISGRPFLDETPTSTPTSTPPYGTTTPPYTTTTPPITYDLTFRDFDFFQNNQQLTVQVDDVVNVITNQGIIVSLFDSKILPGTEKIVLNLSINGRVESYIFNYSSESKTYSATLPGLLDSGKYWATIVVMDRDNQAIKTLYGWLEAKEPQIIEVPAVINTVNDLFVKPIQEALKPITEIAQSPAGQTTAAATVALSVINIAVAVPWWNWWYLLQFIFTQPFQLFFRRKGWGVVYNSITKKPVDLALVRLYDSKTNKLLASKVTDRYGRYIFLIDEGDYYIKVEKPGFEFPSKLLRQTRDDGNYLDLYYGNEINVGKNEKVAIIANIPLDQEDKQLSDAEIIKKVSKQRLARYLSWTGPIVAVIYLFIFPSWLSLSIVVIHLLVLIYFRRATLKKSGKRWGIVYDVGSKKPLKQAITRIFSSEYGRMLEFYVTDSHGRYGFLVGDNKYYVMADKPGYNPTKTPIIDLTKAEKDQEIIAKDLGLVKQQIVTPVSNEEVKTIELPEIEEVPPTVTTPEESKSTETIVETKPKQEIETASTEVNPEINQSLPSIDLGSIDEIKDNLNIKPETVNQEKKMDLDIEINEDHLQK